MTPPHRVSRTAIDLIKRFEGYRRTAAELPDGRWTIGHGHTQTARKGAEVSRADAEALLIYDLIPIAHGLNESVFAPLSQNQFDALAAFAFNIGLDDFRRSGVLKRLNEGAPIQAACAMELWRKADIGGEAIVIDALVRRRAMEKALFLTPLGEDFVPAPSPSLRPLLDTDAIDLVPRHAPAEVTTSLEGDTVVVQREDAPRPDLEPPADEAGPIAAAAEAVTARLQTIFQEPPAEVVPAAAFEAPAAPPENLDEPFVLHPPQDEEESEAEQDPLFGDEPEFDEPAGPDLFDEPVLDEPEFEEVDPAAFEGAPPHDDLTADDFAPEDLTNEEMAQDALLAPETEPFEFLRPIAQTPLPEEPRAGLIGLLMLALVGLAFFAGGVFWATNARSGPQGALDPRVVGWLAGVAGVGFFVIAVYLLLQRLGRAAEREARIRDR